MCSGSALSVFIGCQVRHSEKIRDVSGCPRCLGAVLHGSVLGKHMAGFVMGTLNQVEIWNGVRHSKHQEHHVLAPCGLGCGEVLF
jgi:hypothetical protein